MVHRVLNSSGKVILLGNEAIVRGALESGIGFSAAYPGTPSSEIGDTFSEIAREAGVYFEYSTNEKVAVEAAAGAAFSGVRSLVSFKHFGFNVASDSIFPLPYYTLSAGMVIVCADDPGCWSSGQSEEDSRLYARIAHLPLLEPSTPSEAKDFVKFAFELSEKFKIPVIIRTSTRVSHASEVVKLGKIVKGKTTGKFIRNRSGRTMPPKIIEVHAELHKKLEKLGAVSTESKLNFVLKGEGDFGIITSGVSYNYVREAMKMLNLNLPVLKIGFSWPGPNKKIKEFIKDLKSVLVVEELEPVLEKDVVEIAKEANPGLKIHGKDHLHPFCELRQELVAEALAKISNIKFDFSEHRKLLEKLNVPARTPIMCPGCPHRASFWAAKQAGGKDAVFGGDIGCYLLGLYPPFQVQDYIISMGAGEGVSHGIKKVSQQKVISFIGDSTFFHAGIPALINMTYNKSTPLVLALDNRSTAMTGHQPNPGTGLTGMGDKTKELKINEIAKACGVDNIAVVNCFNLKDSTAKIKDFLAKDKASLIVMSGECRLQFMRRMQKQGTKIPVFQIDQEKCTKCGKCLLEYACPAIHRDDKNKYYINESLCWGCSCCAQVCPVNAISVKIEK